MKEPASSQKIRRIVLGFSLLLTSTSCEEVTPRDSSRPVPLPQGQAETTVAAPSGPPPWAGRVSPTGGFPCDVDEVLAASCRRCHFDPPENDAPFPLLKYEHTQQLRSGKRIIKLMEQMVEADLMPPLDEPVEPQVTPLTPDQKKTLLSWFRAGAPKNQVACPSRF